MTESEWDASDNPEEMLGWLYGSEKVPSERKLRLYYAACCRRMWDFFTSLSKDMIAFFEGHAESPRSNAERVRAADMVDVFTPGGQYISDNQVIPLRLLSRRNMGEGRNVRIPRYVSARLVEAERGSLESNDAYHALLLRDVVGNPFRAPSFLSSVKVGDEVVLEYNPSYRMRRRKPRDRYRSGTVTELLPGNQMRVLPDLGGLSGVWERPAPEIPSYLTPDALDLALAAYDDYDRASGKLDPSRLKVLADALEESGCSESELLGHLRGPGPHVRGCWVLDLILGKE